jgi:hypothetical protein
VTPHDGQTLGPLIGIGVAMAFLIFRMSTGKARPLNAATMWIVPGLLLAGFIAFTWSLHLPVIDDLWLALALAAGSALGWLRGRMMPIHLDPETGRPMVKVSPAALIFIVGLIAARYGLKQFVESHAAAWHANPMLIADGFMAFAVGLLGVARIEMFLRAQKLALAHADKGKLVN